MKSIPRNWQFILFATIFLLADTATAETIHLKSGMTIEGTIVERTDDAIKVDTGFGVPVTYYLDEIENIANTGVINPAPDLQPEIIPASEPETTPPADVEPAPVETTPAPVPPAPAPAPSAIERKIEKTFPLYAQDVASLPPWQAPKLTPDEYLKIQAQRARSLEQERINSAVFVLIESLSTRWRELKAAHPLIRQIAESPVGLAIAAFIWLGLYALVCYPLMLLSQRFKCGGGMAWVPIFQIFQMLRVAGKTPVWFLFLVFPLVNILAFLFVWMAIARRLEQPHWLGYLMLVPGLNILLLWYLAFVPAPAPKKRPEDIDTGIKYE